VGAYYAGYFHVVYRSRPLSFQSCGLVLKWLSLTGVNIVLSVDASETIKHVKSRLCRHHGISAASSLVFNGRSVDDGELSSYNIHEAATIHVQGPPFFFGAIFKRAWGWGYLWCGQLVPRSRCLSAGSSSGAGKLWIVLLHACRAAGFPSNCGARRYHQKHADVFGM
jgi:hypothetical protein